MKPEAEAEGSTFSPNSEELKLTSKQDWQDWQGKPKDDKRPHDEGGGRRAH